MKYADFSVGCEFRTYGGIWRCTDIGIRTIIAIRISDYDDTSWLNGPPYAVCETVFDKNDLEACTLTRA